MGDGGKRRKRKPMDGFRPGKEPAHLRKRRAKASLGDDSSWAQEKMIDAIGDQTPDEVRAMVGRWTTILLASVVVLAVVGGLLYRWSVAGGVAVHFLTVVVGILWFRLRSQRQQIVEMAEWIQRR